MKKIYTFVLMGLLGTFNIVAQPVLEVSNFPTAYSASINYSVSFSSIPVESVTNSGANQLWDFSNIGILLCLECTGQNTLVPCSETPYAATFPTANYCYRKTRYQSPNTYTYMRVSPMTFEELGYIIDGGGGAIYNNPLVRFQFPYEFNSEIINVNPSATFTYDAYGTLIILNKTYTYQNVIRTKTIYDNGNITYTWFNSDPFFIVLEATVSSDGFFQDGTAYFTNVATGSLGVQQHMVTKGLTIFPNPANSFVNVELADNAIIDNVIITDLSGRVVVEKTDNLSQIAIQSLSKGVYVLSAYSGKNVFQTKFFKE